MTLSTNTYCEINVTESDTNKKTKILKNIEKIDKKLVPTKLGIYIIKRFGVVRGKKIMAKIISFWEFIITISVIIGLLVSTFMTTTCIMYFSAVSSNTTSNTTFQNMMYILICISIFTIGIVITLGIVILLDYLQIRFIGLSNEKKKYLKIKKSSLYETLKIITTENHLNQNNKTILCLEQNLLI